MWQDKVVKVKPKYFGIVGNCVVVEDHKSVDFVKERCLDYLTLPDQYFIPMPVMVRRGGQSFQFYQVKSSGGDIVGEFYIGATYD